MSNLILETSPSSPFSYKLPYQVIAGKDEDKYSYLHVDEDGNIANKNYVWNPSTLAWEKMVQPILEAGSVSISGTISETPLSTFISSTVTLTNADTAYKLPSSEMSGRRQLVIYNASDADIYIGDSTVTTSTGILIPAGGTLCIDASANLYAVCGSSGKTIRVLEGK